MKIYHGTDKKYLEYLKDTKERNETYSTVEEYLLRYDENLKKFIKIKGE